MKKPKEIVKKPFLLGFIFLLLSCSEVKEKTNEKLNLLNRKADKLDSLVNSEMKKVKKLDSMLDTEINKIKSLDSIIHSSAIADSLLNKVKTIVPK